MPEDLAYRTATGLLALLESGTVSSLDLTRAAIARIEALDGAINAVVLRRFEAALAEAAAADAARRRGERAPLLGLPMTVKESFNLAGLPTSWGLPSHRDWRPAEDAAAVARLRAAGAVILGKTNVPFMLDDWQSFNPVYGTTGNPWDLGRTPGGSSGGSAAALAAGFVPLELGTDIGGSLRVPAHFCGVLAHAPSLGLVPVRGHVPPGVPAIPRESDLMVAGPMARSAADLSLLLDVIAGPDGPQAAGYRLALPPPRFESLAECRVLVVTEHPLVPLGREVAAAVEGFADRLAPKVKRLGRDAGLLPDLSTGARVYMRLLSAGFAADASAEVLSRSRAAVAAMAAEDDSLRAHSLRGLLMDHGEWIRADRIRTGFRHRWSVFFRDWDVVVAPAFALPALPHDHSPAPRMCEIDGTLCREGDQLGWAGISTMPGLPSTAFPVGRSAAGLPIGLQAIGPFLEDRTTIAFAGLVAQAFGGFAPPPLSSAAMPAS
ncbi:amidase [Paracraurococcus lichenis]|uniref:Amidase n=1 Tax=Paracraurococcus lichenis TaxID=3064888 RepID=A0ABT9DX73_9PROT|nr:amidase [Paracraurococcus sp. LOR1-02]MDO9708505.1 amidase [Paracraurococcus sp. LOR1-02]